MINKIFIQVDMKKAEGVCINAFKILPRKKSLQFFLFMLEFIYTLEKDFHFVFLDSTDEGYDLTSLFRTYYCEKPFDLYS